MNELAVHLLAICAILVTVACDLQRSSSVFDPFRIEGKDLYSSTVYVPVIPTMKVS